MSAQNSLWMAIPAFCSEYGQWLTVIIHSDLMSVLRTFWTIASLGTPFCYWKTCTQNGHM